MMRNDTHCVAYLFFYICWYPLVFSLMDFFKAINMGSMQVIKR